MVVLSPVTIFDDSSLICNLYVFSKAIVLTDKEFT